MGGYGVQQRDGFEDFVYGSRRRMRQAAFLLTGDWLHAEDLTQAAYIKVWKRWERLNLDNPAAYAMTTLVNTFRSDWRRKWRGETPHGSIPEATPLGDEATSLISRLAVFDALQLLSRKQRAVIVMRFFVDLTEQQTADALKIPIGTVKSSTSSVLARLRQDPTLQSLLQEIEL